MFSYHCTGCDYYATFDFKPATKKGTKCPNGCDPCYMDARESNSFPFNLEALCSLLQASKDLAEAATTMLRDGKNCNYTGNAIAMREALDRFNMHKPQL